MKLTQKTIALIADLEYLIGDQCYNPHSYDGWNDIEGCAYRYPITIPVGANKFDQYSSNLNQAEKYDRKLERLRRVELYVETIKYMKYKFGANELFIGQGLIKVLEYLEDRYGLDFNELEKNYHESK